jgi:hypothetical protein
MVVYECGLCGAIFTVLNSFQDHTTSLTACNKFKNKRFDCNCCNKKFSSEKSLKFHRKTKCNIIQDKTQINTSVERPKKIINNTENINIANTINSNNTITNDNSITNTANITSNQTINNNLTIVNFGKEDINKLTELEKKEILNSCYGAILRCAKKMNFNPNFPEQRNVFTTNPKASIGYKYEDNRYLASDINDLLDEMISHRISDIRDLIEQNDVLKVAEDKIFRVNKGLDNVEGNKKKDVKSVKKDLKLLFFNYNQPAIENKKKFDETKKLKNKKILVLDNNKT